MPLDKYFKGKGATVMRDMVKEYGPKKGKRVFYATANTQGMKPISHLPKGATLSPKGDLGVLRQKESVAAGGFTDGETVKASTYLTGGPRG